MKKIIPLIAFALHAVLLSPTYAQSVQDAQNALAQGQYKQALIKLDEHLSKQPQDAEARFLRGLSLVMLERDADAIQSFADLARDYPELPEPYNNLAVLYARNGEYDKARDALETAVATHPSYATAHENLGDIYTALASASYNRSLVLDKNNQAVRIKLDLLNQLGNLENNGEAASIVKNRVAAVAVQPSKPAQRPKPVPKPRATSTVPSTTPVLTSSRPVQNTPTRQSTSKNTNDEQSALAAVEAWRAAWSKQDVDGYLGSYSANFKPARGIERSAWEAQRKRRLTRPKSIAIQVLNPEATARNNGQISVRFVQIYESNTYSDQVKKQLDLEKTSLGWQIIRESVLN